MYLIPKGALQLIMCSGANLSSNNWSDYKKNDGGIMSRPTEGDVMLEDLRMIHLDGPVPNIHLQNDC